MQEAIDRIQGNLPFPLLGSILTTMVYFLGNLPRYRQAHRITFISVRPGKNDQAYVEEKHRRAGSKVCKKYDRAQTPYLMVLTSPGVSEEIKVRFKIQNNSEQLRRFHG